MTDFERIRDSALGYLTSEVRVVWVVDLSREGTDYDRAYQKLLSLRERLCRRFGLEPEDEDMEAMVDIAFDLEQAVARGIFDAAVFYATSGSIDRDGTERSHKRGWSMTRPFWMYGFHIAISSVPAVIRAAPAMDFHVNFSWRNAKASTSVITTLSLSTGTTLDVSPICSAR